GGIVGISMITSHFLPPKTGLFVVIFNIPFLIMGFKQMGKTFLIKALYAMMLFSVCLSIFEDFTNATYDSLLATVFGGVALGLGVGLVLRSGGCLDGTEIVAIYVNKRTSLSVGRTILLINVIIYSVAGAIFGLESGLYSMLMYFISSKVIDFVETGLEQAKAIMVITEDGELVADEIYKNFGRTVTFIRGEGLVSGTKKDVLYSVVTRAEIFEFRKMINSLDVNAFTTVTDVSEIIGNHMKSKSKSKVIAEKNRL
ncbi:MAG: YitT family protein, partial [Lachnospiraceae bacterium]|nr:YitT family protein [Lachnospiraceae bacterium]